MSFPNVKKLLLSHFSNHLVLNNIKQWKLINSINFVAFQSAFLSIFFALSLKPSRKRANITKIFLSWVEEVSGCENTYFWGLWQDLGAETTLQSFKPAWNRTYVFPILRDVMAAEKWLPYKMFTQEDIYASVEILQFDRGAWQKGADHERLFTRTSDL